MIHVRLAKPEDINEIMELELHWPENQRASREQFEARMQKYPQGFFLVLFNEKTLVGSLTSCPIRYDRNRPPKIGDWRAITNNGYIKPIEEVSDANALYLVSGVIHREYRGHGYFPAMVQAAVELARKEEFQYVTAGAVIPGYRKYIERHGFISAADYVFTREGDRLADPFIERYRQLDFFVPDRDHVFQNYYEDSASDNHAAFVVHKVSKI